MHENGLRLSILPLHSCPLSPGCPSVTEPGIHRDGLMAVRFLL